MAPFARPNSMKNRDDVRNHAQGEFSFMDLSKIDIGKALSALGDKLQGWLNDLVLLLPNLVLALVVVAVAVAVSKLVYSLVEKTMNKATGYVTLNHLTATVARIAALAVGIFIALGVLGLDKTVTSLLAGAGVVGLALAFAFQDIAGNFMSGILLALRRPFAANDIIETNDYFGTVEELNLRSTILRLPQGQTAIIPNSSVIQNPIKNFTKLGQQRIDLSCGVGYGDDLELAESTAIKAIRELEFVKSEKPVELYYDEFGSSSINFKLRFWVDFAKQTDFLKARSLAMKALKVAFDNAGLTIPFPIRTLDFGVNGGVNLDDILPQALHNNSKQSLAATGSSSR